MRRRLRLILAAIVLVNAIVLASYVVSRVRSPSLAVSVEQGETRKGHREFDGVLRIGSYNIAHGRGGVFGASNWDGGATAEKVSRLQRIGALLDEMGLDVVVLNEVDFSCVWSGHVDQAGIIASAGSYPFIVRQRSIDASIPFFSTVFGNAILSRYPVTEAWLEAFEPHSSFERVVAGNHDSVVARIELPDGSAIAVWAVHLEVRSARIRQLAARQILEREAEIDVPLFVIGDFNSRLTSASAVSQLLESGRFQPFPHREILGTSPTFPSENPARVIDWVLFPPDWHLVEGFVGESSLSDHLPVAAFVSRPQPHE